MNYIFAFMIILSLITSFFTGTVNETVQAGLDGAKNSIEIILSFAGIMCMWCGFLKLAEEGGAINALSKLISPIINLLFPKLKHNNKAKEYITANISANLLGVGNAATPAGIAAMQELDKINKTPDHASDEMSIFTVINTSSIQLIPTTIIALRSAFGSLNPECIIPPVWICSITALFCALFMMKIILFFKRKNNKKIHITRGG